jgi:poly-beta-1,6-N-acetyl-D-glucosamine synthase
MPVMWILPTALQVTFWALLTLVVFTYVGYPFFLYLYARVRPSPIAYDGITPSVSVIVCAHNEEPVIGQKIENTLGQEYQGEVQVIVVSDGSTDGTNAILETYGDQIHTIIQPENRGKTVGINTAIPVATGVIVVFTDANVRLAPDAVRLLVEGFADETVGGVCGQLSYTNPNDSATAQTHGIYWAYEEFIKRMESATGSVAGADGSLFAIRRELFKPLPANCIDDFATSMLVIARGWRLIFDDRAQAFEKSSTTIAEDLHRRRRISNRLCTTVRELSGDLSTMPIGAKVRFWAHKRLRWETMPMMLAILVVNAALVVGYDIYAGWLIAQIAFYFVAAVGALFARFGVEVKAAHIPFYFVASNFSQLMGRLDSRLKPQVATWTPPQSTRRF